MTVQQWVFLAGLLVVVFALGVLTAVAWRQPTVSRVLGVAFAVIAAFSTVNLVLVGQRLKDHVDETEARFGERTACLNQLIGQLEAGEKPTPNC